MKPIPKTFEFTTHTLEPKKARVVFEYEIKFENRETLKFSETVIFPKEFTIDRIPSELLENLLNSLHLILGISYYKLYLLTEIKTSFALSREQAEFWNTVYKKGLGEFFYTNKIDSKNLVNFPCDEKANPMAQRLKRKNRALVGIGGGKDSIVAFELLKKQKEDVTALLIETQKKDPISEKVISEMKIGKIAIDRQMDEKILNPLEGAYNGHIPISAIFAFLGYFSAVIYDYSYVIVGNEYSSNFGNIKYLGEEVNHQWSKSMEFEKLFQAYTKKFICPDILYFSLLRPYYEIRIVEMFSRYKKYFSIFSSCNRNFRVSKERPKTLWCGECPKCVFVWTLFSAFLSKKELVKMFGKNLYEDEKLADMFSDILGYGKMKPFDCVGTFFEARAAIFLAKDKFADSFIVNKFIGKIKNPAKILEKVFTSNDAPTLPAKFKLAGAKNVLILGYGKEGIVTERYLEKYFPEIKIDISDKKTDGDYLEKQKGYDLVIKTPGIQKKSMTVAYTTATNLFFSQVRNVTIGITGSKGKSTTASLIYTILKEAGKKVRLVGNIGSPMLSTLLSPIAEDEIFVVELSSYQLDDIEYSPQIAVVTNLFPEHMDYHGSVEKYYAAKKNIINFQNSADFFVFNGKNEKLKNWSKKLVGAIDFNEMGLGNINIPLLGEHNTQNIKAAIAVANILNVSKAAIKKGIENFKSLSHRLEFVGEFSGIKFYDDAISTTPESTIAAILAIPDIDTIFLGGLNRGYDFSKLAVAIDKSEIRNIVFFPDSGGEIEEALCQESSRKYARLHAKSMEEGVKFAFKKTKVGKTCLLSTASPSYSLWKNFEEKGDKFQEAVKSWTNQ